MSDIFESAVREVLASTYVNGRLGKGPRPGGGALLYADENAPRVIAELRAALLADLEVYRGNDILAVLRRKVTEPATAKEPTK